MSHLLAKRKKPFTDGETVAITTDTFVLFEGFKNKSEITAAVSRVPQGPPAASRRVEALSRDVDRQALEESLTSQ